MAAGNFLVFPQGNAHPAIPSDPTRDSYFTKVLPEATVVTVAEFSLGIKNTGTISGPGGDTAGKAVFDQLIIKRSVDMASASLLQLVGTGQAFPWIQLYVMRYTRQKVQQYLPYVGYEFQTAMLVDTDWTAGDDYVTEKLTFLFGAAVVGVRSFNKDGSFGTPVKKGWSAVDNSPNIKDNGLFP